MITLDAELEPVPPGGCGGKGEPDIDRLSNIIKTFNDLFGNIEWKDADKIGKVIRGNSGPRSGGQGVSERPSASDRQNAKMEHDRALNRVVLEMLSDHTELYKQFSDNPNFKRWLTDMVLDATYHVV
jgi:type I restriction enzyme R subunit